MFSNSPAPAALAKRANKAFSSASVMFSRIRPPIGFGLSALMRCKFTETVITAGRLAISTGPANKTTAVNVERRYKLLRRGIQEGYVNPVGRGGNPNLPQAPAGP